jgi:uncharacterized protein YjbJ (UPF0337 family)
MNREIAIGHWNEWMGAMRERWGRLTDDEWQQIQGDRQQLVGTLQRRYGYSAEQAELEVDDFVARHTAVATTPVVSPMPDDTMGAMPVPEERVLPYTNDAGYVRDAATTSEEVVDRGSAAARDARYRVAGATGSRTEVRRSDEAALDNGVRAQPGDVLGLDTGGETTSLGDTAEDEDKRRVDAIENAPPLEDERQR